MGTGEEPSIYLIYRKIVSIGDMECKLKLMTKWLTDTGLQVNESKTEIFLFHKNPQIQVELLFNYELFKSKNTFDVL